MKRSRKKITRNGRKAVAAAEEWERKTKRGDSGGAFREFAGVGAGLEVKRSKDNLRSADL